LKRRAAFTLIEMIVSVVILFLLVFFLADVQQTLKRTIDASSGREETESAEEGLFNLLTSDVLQAAEVNIVHGRQYDVLYLSNGRNSLRGASASFVSYAALKPSGTPIRIESSAAFKLPINSADVYKYHFLPLGAPLDSFKIYKSAKKADSSGCSLLIYIAPKEKEAKIIELGLLNAAACN
jgi:hypothetical protein